MAVPDTPTVRRHKRRTDDGKGLRRMIAGRRFRVPAGVEAREADKRFARIEGTLGLCRIEWRHLREIEDED